MAVGRLLRDYASRWALLRVLTRRELVARYRGTALGFGWSLFQPAFTLVVYALVFGVFVQVGVERYPAFLCAGLVPWTWFAQSTAMGTTSILGHAPFLKQGSMSPAIPPGVIALATAVNFFLTLPLVVGLIWLLGEPPGVSLAFLPVLIAIQGLLCWGLALCLGVLCVRYRDLAQLVQTLLPLAFVLTPVLYPAERVPASFAWVLAINPLAPLVEGYQRAFLGRGAPPLGVLIPLALGVGCVVVGAWLSERSRDRIAEEL
ncbi:MAG: ABC transporter permease [Planctomycetes bacterium]|nr:ABC transporter permease [Planctomycetota bacterium]